MIGFLLATIALLTGTVQGTVRTEGTLEPVAYATLEVIGLDRTVVADDRGSFVLVDVPAGEWSIRAGALGHRPDTVQIRVPSDGVVRVDFLLDTRPVELAGLEVSGEARDASGAAAGPPPVRVEGPSLSLVPGVAEADVFRALQTLPSVAAASDFSSALYVRGGLPDQNLVTLDGAPLFNPYHLGGLFAALDPSAVASVEILPGGFPAAAGDRLSSVVRLRTRDGGRDRVRGGGAIGLLSTRASIDGPLFDGAGSFLVSLRRTYLDLFTDAAYHLGLVDFTVPYGFTDGHIKLTRDFDAGRSLSASFYVNREGVDLPDRMADRTGGDATFDWGTHVGSLEYRTPLSATVSGRFHLAWSRFRGSFDAWEERSVCGPNDECTEEEARHVVIDALTGVRDGLAQADLTWYRSRHVVSFGVELDAYAVEHDIPIAETNGFVPEFSRRDDLITTAAYVEDEWRATDRLDLRLGMRALHAADRDVVLMPRVGAQLELSPEWSLGASGGRYAQALYSLRDSESLTASLIAYDLLDIVGEERGFSTADDVTLGVSWATPSTSVRLDAYAKRMRDLPLPPIPHDVIDAPPLVIDGRQNGTGTAVGLEFFARRLWGDAELTLAYALNRTRWRVDGRSYPPRFERRHSIDATAAFPLGDGGTVSARMALASGQPYTPAIARVRPLWWDPGTGAFTSLGAPAKVLTAEHNTRRLPGYFRLDVAARKDFDVHWFGRDVTLTPYLQIVNVLNTPNVLVGIPRGYGPRPELEFAPQLPILPTIGMEWTF